MLGPVVLPTILVDVERGMKILEEETFGPILPVVKVRDEREAIDRANEGSFGLFASGGGGDADIDLSLEAGVVP